MTSGEDYTLKLWKTEDGLIDENNQRFLEEDLVEYPVHVSTFVKFPNQFLVLYENNKVKLYDSSEHYPVVRTFDVPEESQFIVHNEFNDQYAVLHDNNISIFSNDGNIINKFNFQNFYRFSSYVKILHLMFIGIYAYLF